jgi:hypothetical protein
MPSAKINFHIEEAWKRPKRISIPKVVNSIALE